MTIKELEALPVGTLLYNGRTEAIIRMDGNIKVKVLQIDIPIYAMGNMSPDYNKRPEYWSVIEEV